MKMIRFYCLCLTLTACGEYRDGLPVTNPTTDETLPASPAGLPCWGNKTAAGEEFICSSAKEFWSDVSPEAVDAVGECDSEGIHGYYLGTYIRLSKGADGNFHLPLAGSSDACEITVARCANLQNRYCWMQYGTLTLPAKGQAGPYRWVSPAGTCGGSGQPACTSNMRLRRNPGHAPTPLGNF